MREAVDQGKDGFMEDFGEGTSPETRSADGTPPARIHNRYPRDYHCAVQRIVRGLDRPLVRFQRSGWTGAARCSVNVWGGDPTTVWGFDGLRSAVTQALTIGMSGVSRWGSDIGGYNSFGAEERLSRELLDRWIQLGAVSGVMRTKRSGIALPAYERPQIFDPESLPIWRRYAKLHTQLLPYIQAADAEYRATGMPLMRHGLLTNPGDPRAAAADDQFGFGPDLLAAPVLEPGARTRRLYLPRGRWVDLWRSASYRSADGSLGLRRARVLRGGRARDAARAARGAAAARARRRRGAAAARRRGHAGALPRRRAWCAWPTVATACNCWRSRAGAPRRGWARAGERLRSRGGRARMVAPDPRQARPPVQPPGRAREPAPAFHAANGAARRPSCWRAAPGATTRAARTLRVDFRCRSSTLAVRGG